MNEKYAFIHQPLNFPSLSLTVEEDVHGDLSIYDSLRKKYLVLTPEEWVRQHMIHFLIQYHQYPKSLFSLEKGLKYNTMTKRFDVLVHDRVGEPFLLIECKAPNVNLSQKTMEQVCQYNSRIKAQYIGVSNGINHVFLKFNEINMNYNQISSVPLI
jgi:hypothetical protein